MGLSNIAFIMLTYVPSIPTFWRVFIINGRERACEYTSGVFETLKFQGKFSVNLEIHI